jgi:hypothetical protein
MRIPCHPPAQATGIRSGLGRTIVVIALIASLPGCGGPPPARVTDLAATTPPGSARLALPVAEAAAAAWMRDARLIYIENDAALDPSGLSARWGFLFRSGIADSWRAISIGEGRVVHSGPLAFPFAAPDLPAEWIDSSEAVRRADQAGGRDFLDLHGGQLAHVVLGRGLFAALDGPPTWTVVYRATDKSELAIVVSGADGSILSRFEG